jgi:hypothetical protein
MYNRAETSRIRKEFWISFGLYMKPIRSASGFRVNWPNYKTGVKDIYFRMKAEQEFASIGIEICHSDEELQELYFDQFKQFKKLLNAEIGEEWDWKLLVENEFGQKISKIEKILPNVNVMDQNCWHDIIAFLKPRIIALDVFWDNIKPGFEDY